MENNWTNCFLYLDKPRRINIFHSVTRVDVFYIFYGMAIIAMSGSKAFYSCMLQPSIAICYDIDLG